ncbi:MAG: threonylcarbamoyl-AMP synthase [Parcubacteria group bacterium]|nr:threonylcarbamoyl-AMP synthase [Parcubacteria group bacterium]
MEIIKVDSKRIEEEKIKYITKYLREGKTVILPTDTSYGMAVNALDDEAIDRLYKIKKRIKSKPLSIIVKNIDQARKYSAIDERTIKLFNKYLPGKLTIIVKKKDILPKNLTGGSKLVGLRIPDCEIIRKVMDEVDFPITATSANISGDIEPYSVEEILKQYKNKENQPDLIVDNGNLSKNKPSAIVDLSEEKIKLIRKGPINFKDVVNTLKN